MLVHGASGTDDYGVVYNLGLGEEEDDVGHEEVPGPPVQGRVPGWQPSALHSFLGERHGSVALPVPGGQRRVLMQCNVRSLHVHSRYNRICNSPTYGKMECETEWLRKRSLGKLRKEVRERERAKVTENNIKVIATGEGR